MIRSGFFNANNHDKQYYASDISKLLNALVNDGIFENIGDHFTARPGTGMQVIIGPGMSYINSTWTLNDSDHIVDIDIAPYVSGFSRIDGIFIKSYAETNIATRENDIFYMKGTETSGTPTAPVPEQTEDEVYTPICYVTVSNGDDSITAASIRNVVGLTESPFITGILQTADVSALYSQWSAEWNTWIRMKKSNFDTWSEGMMNEFIAWFNQIKGILSEDAAGNLQNEIDSVNETIASIQSQQTTQGTKITSLEDSLKDVDNDWYEFDVISDVSTDNADYTYRWTDSASAAEKYTGYRNALEGREELLVTLVDKYDVIYGMQKIISPMSTVTKGFSIIFTADYRSTTKIYRAEITFALSKNSDYMRTRTYRSVDDPFLNTLHIKVYRHRKYKPAD